MSHNTLVLCQLDRFCKLSPVSPSLGLKDAWRLINNLSTTYQQLINNLSTTCQQPGEPRQCRPAATPGTESGTPRTPVRSACHGVAHGRARTFIPFAPSGPAQRASCPAPRRDSPRFAAPPLRGPAPVDLRRQVVGSLCIAVTERRSGRASGAQIDGERVRLPAFALPGKGKAPLSESPAPCFSRASRRWRRPPSVRRRPAG